MKNSKLLILLFTIYCLLFTKVVFAFREMDDYLFQSEKYREDYDQFTVSRDKFLTYKILSARKQAIDATKRLLLQRNQVLRTYFLALKQRLRTAAGVIEADTKESLISQLDKKIIWIEEEDEEIENLSTPSLDDLFILSDRIEDKNEELKGLSYQSLSEIVLGKIRSLQQESVAATALLKEQVFKDKTATQAAQLNLWLKEVSVKNYLAQKEIEAAEVNLWKLKGANKEKDMVKHFNNLCIDADDAKIYLGQALSFQKEILTQLNND